MKEARPIPEPILELRKRVEDWRKARAAKGPMPEELWSKAVELAREHGIGLVSRGAGLGHDGVKKRVEARVLAPIPEAPPAGTPFVELPMTALGGGEGPEVAVVELRDVRGRCLTVRLMPKALAQLPQISSALWRMS